MKQSTRKLAAIVFTDIVGFTNFTAKDQTKASALLKQQRELFPPIVENYKGMLKWMNFCHSDCIHPRADFLKKELISICKKKNVFINTWTVNPESSIDFCKKLGVSRIITDISKTTNV
jgi:class 3 adenylate cyclase|tara:strand:+ start:51 stop:404 length:354 start_codon:yes stop_codon:yes gene_type:complete